MCACVVFLPFAPRKSLAALRATDFLFSTHFPAFHHVGTAAVLSDTACCLVLTLSLYLYLASSPFRSFSCSWFFHLSAHTCVASALWTLCNTLFLTTRTLPFYRSDTTLQAIVYKLVPGLYERELMRKRAFYKDRPQEAALATPEQRGDDTEHLIFSPSDDMSLSLEYAELG